MNYQAAVVTERGKIQVESFPMPELDSRDMLVKVELAGVCGTDVHLLNSEKPFPWEEQQYPFRLGHEWVGVIEKMGDSFPRTDMFGEPIKEGDRIVCYPSTWACGSCYACKVLLQPNLCMRPPFPRDLPDMGSAFSEYIYIPEGSTVYRIPDSVSSKAAVLVEPFAGALRAFERSFLPGVPDRYQGMGPGKSVVIMGSGTIGTLMVILAKLAGASPIIVVGGPKGRLELCKKFGADITIDIADTTREERIETVLNHTIHRLGADAVFECAGAPSAFIDGIQVTRMGGSLVEFGHYTDRGTIPINPLDVCRKDIQILGSWGYGQQEFASVVRILAANSGKIPFEDIVTHSFALQEIQDALEIARKQDCTKAVIQF